MGYYGSSNIMCSWSYHRRTTQEPNQNHRNLHRNYHGMQIRQASVFAETWILSNTPQIQGSVTNSDKKGWLYENRFIVIMYRSFAEIS